MKIYTTKGAFKFLSRLLLLNIFIITVTFGAATLKPLRLTCEYIENPLGIDTKKPRFSWNVTSDGRNQKQSAYEIVVSDNENDAKQNKGNVWHVSSGIFGVTMMFDVLRQHNKNEIAYRVANQRNYPGWGYMLDQGATTLWQSWQYPDNAPSQNHPMFGSIDEWFYRSLLGINAATPGFKKIIIKPQPAGDLTWAKGSYRSIQGTIVSDWKIDNKRFILKVTIPSNASAEVWIPSGADSAITENDKPVNESKDVKFLRHEDGYAVLQIGSGAYSFSVSNEK